jgi:NAD(P)-dependent dehydrogenase (short-subunit alcohol dehydrogenase family)
MLSAGYGRIVNVASVTGLYMSSPGSFAYSAAKAGLVGLTHALALEVASSGVTVDAAAPPDHFSGRRRSFRPVYIYQEFFHPRQRRNC